MALGGHYLYTFPKAFCGKWRDKSSGGGGGGGGPHSPCPGLSNNISTYLKVKIWNQDDPGLAEGHLQIQI